MKSFIRLTRKLIGDKRRNTSTVLSSDAVIQLGVSEKQKKDMQRKGDKGIKKASQKKRVEE